MKTFGEIALVLMFLVCSVYAEFDVRSMKDFQRIQKQAENGDSIAMRTLAKAYRDGRVIPRNYVTAAEWHRKAALAGDVESEKLLGICYATGIGVPSSVEAAEIWLRRSSDRGNADAQFYLGMLLDAEGKEDAALKQWTKAAQNGHVSAQTKIGLHLLESDSREDQRNGVAWLRKAAERDDPTAQWRLGKFLDESIDVSRNRNEAVEWYRKSGEQGNRDARKKLLEMGISDIPLNRYLISTKTGVPVKIPIPEGYELADSVKQAALDLESEILGDSILLPVFLCSVDLKNAELLPLSKPASIRTICQSRNKQEPLGDAEWERMRNTLMNSSVLRDGSAAVNGSVTMDKALWEPLSGPGWFGTFSTALVETDKVEDALKSFMMFSGFARVGTTFVGVTAYYPIGTLESLDRFPKVVESYLRQLYELNKAP
jgi:TPR repeat protein